jgi:hypothetical protein
MPTTAQITPEAARAGLPGSVTEIMKAGEKPSPAPRAPKKENVQVYIKALTAAEGFHKKAFYQEIATCLVFYGTHTGVEATHVSRETKAALRGIYTKAGYACADTKGEDYKTVVRRITVAEDLFFHLGGAQHIQDWTDDLKPAEAIQHVASRMEKDKLDGIDAIRKLVEPDKVARERAQAKKRGAPVQPQSDASKAAPQASTAGAEPQPGETPAVQAQTEGGPSEAEKAMLSEAAANNIPEAQPVAHDRRVLDKLPASRILATEHIKVHIPLEASQSEVMQLAQMLLMFAQTMQPVAVAA